MIQKLTYDKIVFIYLLFVISVSLTSGVEVYALSGNNKTNQFSHRGYPVIVDSGLLSILNQYEVNNDFCRRLITNLRIRLLGGALNWKLHITV